MAGLYVPDDWDKVDDGYCTITIDVPNSTLWRAMINGALRNLADVSYWDADTGDADQAVEVAKDICKSSGAVCP